MDNRMKRFVSGACASAIAYASLCLPAIAQASEDAPCSAHARACVDVSTGQAWLQDNGRVVYGPVSASGGMPGQDTPTGQQNVTRKVKDEWSYEFDAPMPNAVYFGVNGVDNGIAFHADDPTVLSNGCVHLTYDDSARFYDFLNVGDIVEVVD